MIKQVLFNKSLKIEKNGKVNWLKHQFFKRIFYLISKFSPELVDYKINNISIKIPPKHVLPFFLRKVPQYSMNVGRVAKICMNKYPDGIIIDIGANIGDTAAIIRSHLVKNKIISVEGVRQFYDVLKVNANLLKNITTLNYFIVSDEDNKTDHALVKVLESGNAVLYNNPDLYKESENAIMIPASFKTLESIILENGAGENVKFLKTDIEGNDLPLLNANLKIIENERPLVFF
jgi:FkbM family methyltransferase